MVVYRVDSLGSVHLKEATAIVLKETVGFVLAEVKVEPVHSFHLFERTQHEVDIIDASE